MNRNGIGTIYRAEMARMRRTFWQSIATPIITTVLYFVVFGRAIGSRIPHVGGIGYGAFIIPGLIMLTLLTPKHRQRLHRHLFPDIHENRL